VRGKWKKAHQANSFYIQIFIFYFFKTGFLPSIKVKDVNLRAMEPDVLFLKEHFTKQWVYGNIATKHMFPC
jgi:hypothetical protein